MSPFPELTEGQRQPLLKLVAYQEAQGQEQVFQVESSWEVEIKAWDSDETVVAQVAMEVVDLWADRGFVNIGIRQSGGPWPFQTTTFVLCEEALEYKKRQSYSPVRRWIADMLDMWATDLRAAFIAAIFTVLTTMILKALGLL